MQKKSQADQLIQQLCVRFQRKPRKCKKKNDSGIGQSERIVCVSNDRFYYYPKIQQFNDLDFDKLQYVVPKAGIKLSQILELKFPPRRSNERHYFTITIPNNKILKYTKTFKEMVIDQSAEGQQNWTFIFDYDIISLPELQRRMETVQMQEKQKMNQKKLHEEQEFQRKQEELKKKMDQEYESLVQTQRLISEKESDDNKKKKNETNEAEQRQKIIEQADEARFHDAYLKLLNVSSNNEAQLIECELDLLESIGKFKKRAEQVVKNYIDQLAFNQSPTFQKPFLHKNLIIRISLSKHLNLEYLDSMKVAHSIYNMRKRLQNKIRIPLMAFLKYKGFKILVRAVTPCDSMSIKEKQQLLLHGNFQENWKTHFFLVDDLNIILDSLNLKPYNTQLFFQRVVIHLGTHLEIISTKQNPFQSVVKLAKNQFSDLIRDKVIYAFNISQVFPIDLDLEKNIKQDDVRLRPQYVQNYKQYSQAKQTTKLVGGALTYQHEDEQGNRDDLALAKAAQSLKYHHLMDFTKDLDKLKFVPMSSQHLRLIMKENGINMRYISSIYKMTSLPYIRQMMIIEAIAREVKKIYRDYQQQFIMQVFRKNFSELITQAYDKRSMNSLKVISQRQLFMKQRQKSIQNSIDFLNLVFGNSVETQNFWEIIKRKVKQNHKIPITEHRDLSHGYLLLTILDHCGFSIKLNSSLMLFSVPEPFTNKDWLQFKCKTSCFTFPSLEVYKKCKITNDLTEQAIINRLELNLYICRALGNYEGKVLSQLSTYTRNADILTSEKYSIETLRYYVTNAALQNFEKAYDICTFVLPSSHPYFQDLYLQYAALKTSDAVILKKAAENHSIRTLGLNHWKTSSILSGFQQQSYLKHLISAEVGVQPNKKMELYHKIVRQQARLGKFIDCFNYVKIAIAFAVTKKDMSNEEQEQFYRLLMIGMQITYRLRKIQDLLKISQYFWNYLQKFRRNIQSHQYFQHILYYCLKGYLESSNKKYYLFKIVIVLSEKLQTMKQIKKPQLLNILRQKCRQSKNHINWLKQLLTKLQFAHTQINYLPDFFTHFWQNVEKFHSEELDQGLDQMMYLVRVFKKKPFQEALLDKAYTFDKGSQWNLPKILPV